jgi:hypothetical protein
MSEYLNFFGNYLPEPEMSLDEITEAQSIYDRIEEDKNV